MWWIYTRGVLVGMNLLCLINQIISNQISIISLVNLAVVIIFTVLAHKEIQELSA